MQQLPTLYQHFQLHFVPISLLSTDWIIGLFMNCLPLELTAPFLDNFFKDGWPALYELAIGILRFHEKKLLQLKDGSEIITVIK